MKYLPSLWVPWDNGDCKNNIESYFLFWWKLNDLLHFVSTEPSIKLWIYKTLPIRFDSNRIELVSSGRDPLSPRSWRHGVTAKRITGSIISRDLYWHRITHITFYYSLYSSEKVGIYLRAMNTYTNRSIPDAREREARNEKRETLVFTPCATVKLELLFPVFEKK